MHLDPFPFEVIDWNCIKRESHPGETGRADCQLAMFGDIRIRKVSYSSGYKMDHWCKKGHIIHCLDGEMVMELEGGKNQILTKGMTYVVGDGAEAHKGLSNDGCTLLIID